MFEHQQLHVNFDLLGGKWLNFLMFGVGFGGLFSCFCAAMRIDINPIPSMIAFHIDVRGFRLGWLQWSAEKWVDKRLRRIDMVKVGSWIKFSFKLNKCMVHHGEVVEIIIMLSDDMGNGFRHGKFG